MPVNTPTTGIIMVDSAATPAGALVAILNHAQWQKMKATNML